MKQLIINADDFGYSRGVNHGIIDAYTSGVLTSTTLMTNMPGAAHAYALAAEHPGLGVGIHLTLTCGRPLVSGHQTIVEEEGTFRTLSYYSGHYHIDEKEVYEEWKAQIDAAVQHGITPTHLDSHHHIHSYPGLTEVYTSLAALYQLPVRTPFPEGKPEDRHFFFEATTTDHFEPNIETLKGDIEEMFVEAEMVELMTHPAYLDKPLIKGSSFLFPRADELALLTDPQIVRKLQDFPDLKLINYRELS
ncbi:carbohydrate deacetylase [Salibacterium aidingense]|uniref:carbohydrate deacetylase n=1 Tax=Salibacterium aidingense TaxID=384933 RepID=UPI003BBC3B1A